MITTTEDWVWPVQRVSDRRYWKSESTPGKACPAERLDPQWDGRWWAWSSAGDTFRIARDRPLSSFTQKFSQPAWAILFKSVQRKLLWNKFKNNNKISFTIKDSLKLINVVMFEAWWWGQFIANFLLSSMVKFCWKSVNIWLSFWTRVLCPVFLLSGISVASPRQWNG